MRDHLKISITRQRASRFALPADARRPLALAALALVSLAGELAIWPLMPVGMADILSPIALVVVALAGPDRKSTRLNSSHR